MTIDARALRDAFARVDAATTTPARARFDARLRAGAAQVASYEDELATTCATSATPTETLRREGERTVMRSSATTAREREREREATDGTTATTATTGADEGDGVSLEDATLLALLRWFKEDFFEWVDKPKCEKCGNAETRLKRTDQGEALRAEEREGEASRAEVYECSTCRAETRFPRYNSAIKLLDTRRGRCGEWANAFTLCCRAMGYRARWVLDWTDHVWTEVYSERQKRWLHCDPCENVCDKPLLYEQGWGKQLSYVIAFSVEGVVDVTKRYTKDMKPLYRRRGEVYEPWLKSRCDALTRELRMQIPANEVKELEAQDAMESLELDKPAVDIGESLPGRQTGSFSWRAARGELGNQQ